MKFTRQVSKFILYTKYVLLLELLVVYTQQSIATYRKSIYGEFYYSERGFIFVKFNLAI